MGDPEPRVVHNRDEERFEVWLGDSRVGVLDYETVDDVRDMFHTEVEPELRRRGLAARLVEEALNDTRAHGLRMRPSCAYVDAYLRRHPEHQDLVAPAG